MTQTPLGTIRRTGQKCPESGIWQAQTPPKNPIPLSEGETFPPHQGAATDWKLIRHA